MTPRQWFALGLMWGSAGGLLAGLTVTRIETAARNAPPRAIAYGTGLLRRADDALVDFDGPDE